MIQGYLFVETSVSHPGLVRLAISDRLPSLGIRAGSDRCIRYIARFSDATAALMHVHDLLRRRLVDLENRIYRSDPLTAIAYIEADELKHECVYLHPRLVTAEMTHRLQRRVDELKQRFQRRNRIWLLVGKVAIGLLLLNLLIFI